MTSCGAFAGVGGGQWRRTIARWGDVSPRDLGIFGLSEIYLQSEIAGKVSKVSSTYFNPPMLIFFFGWNVRHFVIVTSRR